MSGFARIRGAFWATPWDGRGFLRSPDPDLDAVIRWSAREFWRRFPAGRRTALRVANRVLFPLTTALRVRRFGWSRELLLDCLASGARPVDAWVWRAFFPESGRHPMPGGTLSFIGDAGEHGILRDKVRTAALLRTSGLPVPAEFDPADDRTWSSPNALIVKPRFGSGGRGVLAVDVLPDGLCQAEGRGVVPASELRSSLDSANEELVVQERVKAHPDLADLAPGGTAPVLRINVARFPGGEPCFHSAHLAVAVPGEPKRNFIRSHMRMSVDADGALSEGVWFASPETRFAALPWNGAPLAGRVVRDASRSIRIALDATRHFPGLALVNWDLIPSPGGPVILEGNSCGNWALTQFNLVAGKPAAPLPELLRRWATRDPI